MAKKSEAKSVISLDAKPFQDGAKKVIDAATRMSAIITTTFAAAGVAMLAAFGAETIGGVGRATKDLINFGEEMANAGKRAGLAAGQFYLFNQAIEKGVGMKTMAKLIGENAAVLDRSASVFRDVSLKLWAVGERIRGFWLGLMERVTPVLSRLLDGTLGFQLVSAGQAFGEKLAKAVAVVYQLAKDGKVWSTMKDGFKLAFNYAGERMIWLSQLGKNLLEIMFSSAFVEGMSNGISKVWEMLKNLASDWADKLGSVIFDLQTEFQEMQNSFLDGIDRALNAMGLLSGKQTASNIGQRASEIKERRQAQAVSPKTEIGVNTFLSRIAELVQGSKLAFKPSNELAKQMADFQKGFTDAFAKYKRDEAETPTTSYENNTRRFSSGVDSLASIGGGGNVYLGLSVLDVQKSQLRVLERIDMKLGTRSPGTTNNFTLGAQQQNGISRAQTSGVINNVK